MVSVMAACFHDNLAGNPPSQSHVTTVHANGYGTAEKLGADLDKFFPGTESKGFQSPYDAVSAGNGLNNGLFSRAQIFK